MTSQDNDRRYMQLALDVCAQGVAAGQSPFGACIVRDGKVLACEHNRVVLNHDCTAHAEVQALRAACAAEGSHHLPGATIYSTTEPCPMCFTAIHWARCGRIVYAARVEDAKRFGFNELQISNNTMKRVGIAAVEITADFMRDEAIKLYEHWKDGTPIAY